MKEARAILAAAGVVNATEADRFLEAALGVTRSDLLTTDPEVERDVARRFFDMVERRRRGEPMQYVTGTAAFRHIEVAVGPGVFIPRPETELVAERAMDRLPKGGVIVDVGTGSGAIALAIADERPDGEVWATEVSPEALAWARKNRSALGARVELVAGDLLEPLPRELARRIDVVVSNMPYVPVEETALVAPDVVAHEPHVALFGPKGGVGLIRRLAGRALEWLRPGGWIVLEIGDRQGAAVVALLTTLGYDSAAVYDDLTGRERIVEARLSLRP